MLKLTVAVVAIALAGIASAADWRDLRVDASSEAAYQRSLAIFNAELAPSRQSVFSAALIDIWLKGTAEAEANQGQYTVDDYYQQLHGLSYEEVVTFTDPSGKTAKARQRDAERAHVASTAPPVSPWQEPFHASQEARAGIAHTTMDGASPMRTRQGGHVESSPMPTSRREREQ